MNTYKVEKKTGTYAELLETFGFANLLDKIFKSANVDASIAIIDKNTYYEVSTNIEISDEIVSKQDYYPFFKFIKHKVDSDISEFSNYYDYPLQREWKKEKQKLLLQIYKDYSGKDKRIEKEKRIKEIERIYDNERRLDNEFDVYTQISTPNNFPGFEKLYQNFHLNKENFAILLWEILYNYGKDGHIGKEFEKATKNWPFHKTVTATQLYNPNQGQGLNKPKADGLNRKNFDSSWICESMKISGALTDMICQLVKVGSSYDLKVFVPAYKQVNYNFKDLLIVELKKYLKGNTPIKIDILNILLLTQKVIEHSEFMGRRKRVKEIVSGLHSVYQKDLGQNKAVINIGFIQVPNFIEISNKQENQDWIDLLEEQRSIIAGITELGDSIQGLLAYRNFISGSDVQSFFKFSHWYSGYLTSQLSNNKYARPFTIETLDKFYKNMETNELKLSEIISNEGFKAVAGAIRKSTVTLQFTPKESRKYDVRYGVAQTLQSKSKSKEDLAEFIGDFIALYNSETARQAEKTGNPLRAIVRDNELTDFYNLLDNFPSKLVGALLASYGFALPKKEAIKEDNPEQPVEELVEE